MTMVVKPSGRRRKPRSVPRPFTRCWHITSAYLITFLLGPIVVPLIWHLCRTGRIAVRGEERAFQALRKGRIIIAANHPSLIEPFILSTLFSPRFFLRADRLWPWAMPDRRTFLPSWLWWVYPFFRCITVDRKKGEAGNHSAVALRRACFVLESGCSLVVHPEGGRTKRGKLDARVRLGGREMRPVANSRATWLAQEMSAKILPVWVEFAGAPFVDIPGVRGMLLQVWRDAKSLYRHGMVIHFGEPYRVQDGQDQKEAAEELQRRILST